MVEPSYVAAIKYHLFIFRVFCGSENAVIVDVLRIANNTEPVDPIER